MCDQCRIPGQAHACLEDNEIHVWRGLCCESRAILGGALSVYSAQWRDHCRHGCLTLDACFQAPKPGDCDEWSSEEISTPECPDLRRLGWQSSQETRNSQGIIQSDSGFPPWVQVQTMKPYHDLSAVWEAKGFLYCWWGSTFVLRRDRNGLVHVERPEGPIHPFIFILIFIFIIIIIIVIFQPMERFFVEKAVPEWWKLHMLPLWQTWPWIKRLQVKACRNSPVWTGEASEARLGLMTQQESTPRDGEKNEWRICLCR